MNLRYKCGIPDDMDLDRGRSLVLEYKLEPSERYFESIAINLFVIDRIIQINKNQEGVKEIKAYLNEERRLTIAHSMVVIRKKLEQEKKDENEILKQLHWCVPYYITALHLSEEVEEYNEEDLTIMVEKIFKGEINPAAYD